MPPTYHATAKALHWLTALAVFGLLGIGLWMTGLPIGLQKLQVYNWHKWIGLVVLVLTAARLLWRWRHPPPPLPDTVTRWERALAPIGHWALLVLLLAMPASGWLMNSAAVSASRGSVSCLCPTRCRPIPIFSRRCAPYTSCCRGA